MPWGFSWPDAGSASRIGKCMPRRGAPLGILPTWATRANPLFAHVGKRIKRPDVEAADTPRTPSQRAAAAWRRPRHGTPGRQRERVEADSPEGAGAGGLALPGLRGAASARRPPRGEALAGGLRLRPRPPRGPLSLVPRS